MSVAGLLLTGGASRRLGTEKAVLFVGDETLVDRSARVLSAVCDPVIEIGPGLSRIPSLREEPPGTGPLPAVSTGVRALNERGHDDHVLVMALDLPFIEPAVLTWLAQHPAPGTVVPRVRGEAQSLCARYAPDALDAAARLVAAGEHSMRSLLDSVTVTYADEKEWGAQFDARVFDDVDTPNDLKRLGEAT